MAIVNPANIRALPTTVAPTTSIAEEARLRDMAQEAAQMSETRKALRMGALQTRGLVSAGAAALRSAAGADPGMQLARAEELLGNAAAYRPRVMGVEDVQGIRDVPALVTNTIASQLPILGATALTGGTGAIAGRALLTRALARQGLRTLPQAAQLATLRGSYGGAGVGSGALNVGETFAGVAQDPERTSSLQEAAQASLLSGGIAGALDTIPFAQVMNRLGLGATGKRMVRQSMLHPAVAGVAKTMGTEAGTEVAQAILQEATERFVRDNYDLIDDDTKSNLLNSAVLGAIGGGVFGAVGEGGGMIRDRLNRMAEDRELANFRGGNVLRGTKPDLAPKLRNLTPSQAKSFDRLLRPDSPFQSQPEAFANALTTLHDENNPGAAKKLLANHLANPDLADQIIDILTDRGVETEPEVVSPENTALGDALRETKPILAEEEKVEDYQGGVQTEEAGPAPMRVEEAYLGKGKFKTSFKKGEKPRKGEARTKVITQVEAPFEGDAFETRQGEDRLEDTRRGLGYAGTATQQELKLTSELKRLDKARPGTRHEAVPYSRFVEDQARQDGVEPNYQPAAERLAKKHGAVGRKLLASYKGDFKGFLKDNFVAIRQSELNEALAQDRTQLRADQVQPYFHGKRPIMRDEEGKPVLEEGKEQPHPQYIEFKLNGKPVWISAQRLEKLGRDMPMEERDKGNWRMNNFMNAYAALLETDFEGAKLEPVTDLEKANPLIAMEGNKPVHFNDQNLKKAEQAPEAKKRRAKMSDEEKAREAEEKRAEEKAKPKNRKKAARAEREKIEEAQSELGDVIEEGEQTGEPEPLESEPLYQQGRRKKLGRVADRSGEEVTTETGVETTHQPLPDWRELKFRGEGNPRLIALKNLQRKLDWSREREKDGFMPSRDPATLNRAGKSQLVHLNAEIARLEKNDSKLAKKRVASLKAKKAELETAERWIKSEVLEAFYQKQIEAQVRELQIEELERILDEDLNEKELRFEEIVGEAPIEEVETAIANHIAQLKAERDGFNRQRVKGRRAAGEKEKFEAGRVATTVENEPAPTRGPADKPRVRQPLGRGKSKMDSNRRAQVEEIARDVKREAVNLITRVNKEEKPGHDHGKLTKLISSWLDKLGLVGDRLETLTHDELHSRIDSIMDAARTKFGEGSSRFGEIVDTLDDVRIALSSAEGALVNNYFSFQAGLKRLGLPPISTAPFILSVDANLTESQAVSVAAHELGHFIFANAEINAKTAAQIMKSYKDWLVQTDGRSHDEINISKVDILTAMRTFAELRSSKGTSNEYMRKFSEWFADQTARWLTEKKEPRSEIEKFFKSVADLIRQLYEILTGRLKTNETVDSFLSSLWDKRARSTAAEIGANLAAHDFTQSLDLKIKNTLLDYAKAAKLASNASIALMATTAQQRPTSADGHMGFRRIYDQLKPSEKKILGQALASPSVRRQMRDALGENQFRLVDQDSRAGLAYMYQLWTQGTINLNPEPNTLLKSIANTTKEFIGMVSASEQAEELLRAMHSWHGTRDPLFEVKTINPEKRLANLTRFANEHLAKLGEIIQPLNAAQARIYNTANAALIRLTNHFSVAATETLRDTGMMTRRIAQIGEFTNRLKYIFEDELNTPQLEELFNGMMQGKAVTEFPEGPVRKAAGHMRQVFNQMRQYGIDAGLEIGEVENYYPWVFDLDQFYNRREEFLELLSHFPEHVKDRDAAERIYNAIVEQDGYADTRVDFTQGVLPAMNAINQRTLGFLNSGSAADKAVLASFMSKNVHGTLVTYINQLVKRAEYVRTFKADGSGLEAILNEARETGATDQDIELARKFVNAMMGTLGLEETHPALMFALKTLDKWLPTNFAETDPRTLRKIQGYILVYQNYRTLALSLFANMADLGSIIARSNSPDVAWEAFKEGMNEVRLAVYNATRGDEKKYRSALRNLADGLGMVEHEVTNEILQQMYGGVYLSKGAKKWNDLLFKYNGMQGFTKLTRLMALASGKRFLEKLKGQDDEQTKRFLDELNITDDDIVIENGVLRILTRESDIARLSLEDRVRNEKISAALHRYVDQSVIRPDAAQRPIFASHPDAMLFFHLRQFMYSMHDRILRRVFNEAYEGNYWPMLTITSAVPIILAGEMLKSLIQNLGDDPDKEDWEMSDWVTHGVDRSGLTGYGQILFDIDRDIEYGGSGIGAFGSPTTQQATQLVDALLLGNRSKVEALSDSLPGKTVFDHWGDAPLGG